MNVNHSGADPLVFMLINPMIFCLQYNLRVARSEGADARRRAEEATSSYDSIKLESSKAQIESGAAAEAAQAEISNLQVSSKAQAMAQAMAHVL